MIVRRFLLPSYTLTSKPEFYDPHYTAAVDNTRHHIVIKLSSVINIIIIKYRLNVYEDMRRFLSPLGTGVTASD